MSRSFTVDSVYNTSGRKINFQGGRYMSDIPSNAARKAFSQISQTQNMKGRVSLVIHLRETTQNSKHNIYKYKVKRVKKETKVIIDGNTIVYKYITKVKAL